MASEVPDREHAGHLQKADVKETTDDEPEGSKEFAGLVTRFIGILQDHKVSPDEIVDELLHMLEERNGSKGYSSAVADATYVDVMFEIAIDLRKAYPGLEILEGTRM